MIVERNYSLGIIYETIGWAVIKKKKKRRKTLVIGFWDVVWHDRYRYQAEVGYFLITAHLHRCPFSSLSLVYDFSYK